MMNSGLKWWICSLKMSLKIGLYKMLLSKTNVQKQLLVSSKNCLQTKRIEWFKHVIEKSGLRIKQGRKLLKIDWVRLVNHKGHLSLIERKIYSLKNLWFYRVLNILHSLVKSSKKQILQIKDRNLQLMICTDWIPSSLSEYRMKIEELF